jgi:hypothetical protein
LQPVARCEQSAVFGRELRKNRGKAAPELLSRKAGTGNALLLDEFDKRPIDL